ncbi:MAG TPA: tripartite tricarboxylate transporter substrate binding protein [Casimicrobiaceae bacterium]|nr:tripartite tricarboxylate transporter substrate binding protein [Casimicrobiaceae bacterium]
MSSSLRFARFVSLAVAVLGVAVAQDALAQAYPSKPVRIVVPFAPGGRVDGIARLLANSMGAELGGTFVVDNRAGAGGSIGSDHVAKSPADGYTLLLASAGTHAIQPNVDRKLPYDSVKDFTPIANLVEGFTFIGAHPSLNVSDVAGLVKLAKEKPGTLGFATSGVGTYGHFAGELLKIASGADLIHVAYKGSGPALTDLSAGHVPLMIAGELVELAKAGKIRVLATTNERRWPELPDVATMREQGFPQFTVHSWIGLVGPAGMPPAIANRLSEAAGKAINDPKAREQLVKLGVLPVHAGPATFAQQIRADRDAYASIVSGAKLKFE